MNETYGRRLLVGILEDAAINDPNRAFAVIPQHPDSALEYRQVSFKELKAAVDHTVHILRARYKTFELHETLAYVGLSDLRYNILFYAALKCRLKVCRESY